MGRSRAFDDALASFAMAYAEQTVKDHAALVKATGRPKAAKPAEKTAAKRERKPTAKRERKSAAKPERKPA
jgi:hypothetical protein